MACSKALKGVLAMCSKLDDALSAANPRCKAAQMACGKKTDAADAAVHKSGRSEDSQERAVDAFVRAYKTSLAANSSSVAHADAAARAPAPLITPSHEGRISDCTDDSKRVYWQPSSRYERRRGCDEKKLNRAMERG